MTIVWQFESLSCFDWMVLRKVCWWNSLIFVSYSNVLLLFYGDQIDCFNSGNFQFIFLIKWQNFVSHVWDYIQFEMSMQINRITNKIACIIWLLLRWKMLVFFCLLFCSYRSSGKSEIIADITLLVFRLSRS